MVLHTIKFYFLSSSSNFSNNQSIYPISYHEFSIPYLDISFYQLKFIGIPFFEDIRKPDHLRDQESPTRRSFNVGRLLGFLDQGGLYDFHLQKGKLARVFLTKRKLKIEQKEGERRLVWLLG